MCPGKRHFRKDAAKRMKRSWAVMAEAVLDGDGKAAIADVMTYDMLVIAGEYEPEPELEPPPKALCYCTRICSRAD